MTLNRKTADPKQMSAAEIKVAREHLGLTTDWIAHRMGVQERSVHRWEAGAAPVPEGVRIEMEYLGILTDRVVAELAEQARATGVLVTYRTDADYRRHRGAQSWPASWHRAAAARVAREMPSLPIIFWSEEPAP